VTVIGIDGADWRVMDPLLAQGDLPNIAALIDHGVRAPLRSVAPLVSPAIWTTIATGVERERHGIHDFDFKDRRLIASTDRKFESLWSIASAAKMRSIVIGWWATYPAEKIDGVVISERALKIREDDVNEIFGGKVRPPAAAALVHPPEVAALVGDLLFHKFEITDPSAIYSNELSKMRKEDAGVVGALNRLREAHGPFRLEMILLRGLDPVCHFFWRFFEPDAAVYTEAERPSERGLERYAEVIPNYYRYVDSLLGELDLLERPNHVTILISDHGFEAGRQRFNRGALSGTHKSENAMTGIFVASGGPVRQGVIAEQLSIMDIAPTILTILGLPLADDFAGRLPTDILDAGWVAAHPVPRVASYVRNLGAPPNRTSSPADDRLREELRALGYVE
jgi:predicted AlkP superfamily phosphohydrolase/phosphomutase